MTVEDFKRQDGYECPTCEKVVNTSLGLKQHHAKVHNESLVETTECDWCGDTFKVGPSREGNFCSRECFGKDRTENGVPARKRQVSKTCPTCGEEFSVKRSISDDRVHCSQECYNNSRKGEVLSCERCGDEFYAYDTYVDSARFCSQSCYGEWLAENKSGAQSWNWRGDERDTDDAYGPGWTQRKRETVRERYGRECAECGMSQSDHMEQYDMSLHVHHEIKAREHSNPAVYNAVRNLKPLCISCHLSKEHNNQ